MELAQLLDAHDELAQLLDAHEDERQLEDFQDDAPRKRSSLPVPVDGAKVCVAAGTLP